MAITDINISEQLETGAPSIKYTGNEGPQAPMQMAGADPMLIEEYQKYVYAMEEQGQEPVSFEQFVQEIKSGFAKGGRAELEPSMLEEWVDLLKKRGHEDEEIIEIIKEKISPISAWEAEAEKMASERSPQRNWIEKIKELEWDKIKPVPMPGSEKPPLHPDATTLNPHQDINPLRTMEYRDANRDGIEDRSQGIYSKDRDLIPWDFNKPKYLAFGGIAGLDGRRRYGFGSSLKKRIRKIIPNEAARVAEVAAPFVAPFNPAVAAAMSGIGGFDRHGSISKGLKSGLMNYGMGQAARYMGGAELQGNPFSKTGGYGGGAGAFRGGLEGFKGGFSKPIGTNERFFDDWFKGSETQGVDGAKDIKVFGNEEDEILNLGKINQANKGNALNNFLKGMGMNTAAMAGIVGASALAGLYTKKNPGDDSIEQMRGEKLDIDGIRAEVQEAFRDPTGKALEEIRIKYPFLGAKETKNLDLMATGGRAGYYSGGQSIPSEYTVEDARKTAMQDKLGGITDVMKKADLHRQGDIGQMYMAEGGIMDMGGMEKDYRNEGGFVPIGKKEKADDVPARLSVNEFVFTADAVRGAGGGDIDKGAEIMENVMKNLEKGGRMSKESQGLKGAQEMFEVSERLSEVV